MRSSRPGASMLWIVAVAALCVGCTVKPPEGKLECESDEDCPPDWVCNTAGDGTCYSDEDNFPSTDTDADSDSDSDTDADSDTDSDSDTSPDSCDDVSFSFDFESGDQGFTHGVLQGTEFDPWERGAPTDQTCFSGDSCFATVLDGDYENCGSAELVSPTLDISSCEDSSLEVVLRFQHHYLFQPILFDSWRDGGVLQLSDDGGVSWQDVSPSNGYQGPIAGDYGGPCGGVPAVIDGHESWSGEIPGGDWTEVSLTVEDNFKTEAFRFRFLFGSDRTWQETGWVIDDVELVAE